jgi:transcription initiation factor TFIIIB Brf1 subunit/transcription initiation factor TFIIB
MTDEPCPECGSTERVKRYNKWHVKEIYCANCNSCLNADEVRERTRLAEMASREGKLNEFWEGRYHPLDTSDRQE